MPRKNDIMAHPTNFSHLMAVPVQVPSPADSGTAQVQEGPGADQSLWSTCYVPDTIPYTHTQH